MKLVRRIAAVFAALALTFSLSGCTAEKVDMATVSAVIDVRTPEEYQAGHLEGAVNIDVQAADFTMQIDSLDKAGTYLVYCKSGRRAGVAVDYMTSAGFGKVTNLGSVADASAATGLPVIQ